MSNKFYKKVMRVQIIKGHHNHMPPATSNDGGRPTEREAAIVEKKGFQMPPLPSSSRIGAIYTIRFFKWYF